MKTYLQILDLILSFGEKCLKWIYLRTCEKYFIRLIGFT